ncbi:aminoacyl-tRNA deacylase [Chlorobium phaeobacteroides]|jgi:Ala-tRNA(Pro) deacylase|uniref:YbaK/prolyl-tRNA synthetase associated region n=1 Tax=Chlorobium phaeobacteroides (strain DSM 266 / SMG 266 / 2430) TaxID=290317 RepID=A1BID4_CHLPD|nr:YbaK/EbsC family protein [Chlorobium phaeobacteroides]ABL66161.1 YbaK/prolyl-tRNA synthetase associated region [Chlorobium phaeobacteroides DSM 266]MBV5327278.1 YbaK/EbsC family protein [Chlorobium sp.]
MPIKRLREFLDSHAVRYFVVSHSRAYTAQEIAAVAHVPGKELAKTVMVSIDGKMAMVVLPASRKLDFELLKKLTAAEDIVLASEHEFADLFPECEPGAMPPFGNLYGMDVYVSDELAEDEDIAFNAGAHTELVRLSWNDFSRLVQPKIAHLSQQ